MEGCQRQDAPDGASSGRIVALDGGPAGSGGTDGSVATDGTAGAVGERRRPDVAGPTVLHVDRDADIRALVAEFVGGDDGPAVVSVPDATSALERVNAGGVDCVVTAVDLPDADGVAFARALDDAHDLPVVVFTCYESRDLPDGGLGGAVDAYVRKSGASRPFRSLATAVEDLLE